MPTSKVSHTWSGDSVRLPLPLGEGGRRGLKATESPAPPHPNPAQVDFIRLGPAIKFRTRVNPSSVGRGSAPKFARYAECCTLRTPRASSETKSVTALTVRGVA